VKAWNQGLELNWSEDKGKYQQTRLCHCTWISAGYGS